MELVPEFPAKKGLLFGWPLPLDVPINVVVVPVVVVEVFVVPVVVVEVVVVPVVTVTVELTQ